MDGLVREIWMSEVRKTVELLKVVTGSLSVLEEMQLTTSIPRSNGESWALG